MRSASLPALGLTAALILSALSAHAASLQEAAEALGVADTRTIEFAGDGHWFQFGQAPSPLLPWPRFDVSRYVAGIDYDKGAARVQITRIQAEEAGRRRPAPTTQWLDQYVSGSRAWNLPAAHLPQNASAQPAAVEERRAEIWATPQGFIKAALANNAVSRPGKDGIEVSFTLDGKYRYVGAINAANQVERVRTWIDNPVLGDTPVETRYTGYKDFGGVRFPARIVRSQGGHPVLDIQVAEVRRNAEIRIDVPEAIEKAQPAPVAVKVDKLADGVFHLTGGTHHSVAVEQKDHIVLIEAPQNEARSEALIAKLKETIPGKPIRYLVNTHHHFDHSGGLRTFAAEGSTIVTHKLNEAYYRKAWANPHGLKPDRLSASDRPARFETFTGKHVLSDGARRIEIHAIAGNSHSDSFAFVYLPAEKLLIEADAYTPPAADAPLPASPNPYSVNLHDNIRKLKLDVDRIAALHGPRVVTLADLRAAIGQQYAAK